jgi:hypothetical protein
MRPGRPAFKRDGPGRKSTHFGRRGSLALFFLYGGAHALGMLFLTTSLNFAGGRFRLAWGRGLLRLFATETSSQAMDRKRCSGRRQGNTRVHGKMVSDGEVYVID